MELARRDDVPAPCRDREDAARHRLARPRFDARLDFAPSAEHADDAHSAAVSAAAASAVTATGEPVVARFTAAQAAAMLRDAGFGSVGIWDGDRLGSSYLGRRTDLSLPSSMLIAVAAV